MAKKALSAGFENVKRILDKSIETEKETNDFRKGEFRWTE